MIPTVVVAVSGGLDSMALLHMMASSACHTLAVYVNHGLRYSSEIEHDLASIRSISEHFNIPFFQVPVDVAGYANKTGCGLEMAGRILRYQALGRVAKAHNAIAVLTAHHYDDAIESLVLKWLRGSGLGLTQMAPIQIIEGTTVWRPLLNATKQQLLDYCTQYGVKYNEDSSNWDLSYLRNRVRHQVLPLLRSINPRVDEALLEWAKGSEALVGYARSTLPEAVRVGVSNGVLVNAVQSLPLVLRLLVAYDCLRAIGIQPTRAAVNRLDRLFQSPSGRRASICKNWQAFRTPTGIECKRISSGDDFTGYDFLIHQIPVTITIPGTNWVLRLEWVPEQSDQPGIAVVGEPVMRIRSRRPGDRFFPKGFLKATSLNRFLIAQKIPKAWRDRLPLFFMGDQLVWVGFVRGAEGVSTVVGKRLQLSILGEI